MTLKTANSTTRPISNWTIVYGLLLVGIGLASFAFPLATNVAVGVILAATLLTGGVVALIAVFKDAGWKNKTVDLLYAALALIAGFICMVNPFSGAFGLVWAIGIMFLVMGGFEFVSGFSAESGKGWLIALGVVDMLLGFWATFLMGPVAALVTLSTLVGFGFIFRGLALVSTTLFVNHEAKHAAAKLAA